MAPSAIVLALGAYLWLHQPSGILIMRYVSMIGATYGANHPQLKCYMCVTRVRAACVKAKTHVVSNHVCTRV